MSGTAVEDVFDSRSTTDYALIADKEVSNGSDNDLPIKNFVDVHKKKVLDEDFRLAVKELPIGLTIVSHNWNDLTVREQRNWISEKIKDHCPNLPDSLLFLTVGITVNGDCGRVSVGVPEWLDRQKFQRGQRFAMANYAGVTFAEVLSLYMLFLHDYGLQALIVTGKSSTPFTSFKRYLSTVRRVRNWYSSDVYSEGTDAYKDMQMVRNMHANLRKKMGAWSCQEIDEAASIQNPWSIRRAQIREDFRDSCPAPAPGQYPFVSSGKDRLKRPMSLNQSEMAITQFGFMGLVILYPEKFGIHGASDEDLDAYCHLWRGLGYLLGIEDEFNFCRGSVEEVKQRSKDFIEYYVKPNLREITPEWEHMIRCVMEGIKYYIPKMNFELSLLYFADVIGISMPRLRTSLSYTSRIHFYIIKFTLNFTARFSGLMENINRRLNIRIDRALSFTDEELAVLQKRSDITLAEGIVDTIAVQKNLTIAKSKVWKTVPFLVFSTTLLLLNFPIIVKKIQGQLYLSQFVFVKSNI